MRVTDGDGVTIDDARVPASSPAGPLGRRPRRTP